MPYPAPPNPGGSGHRTGTQGVGRNFRGTQGIGANGRASGRNYNTTANNASKRGPKVPPKGPAAPAPLYGLTPDQEQGYATTVAGLQQQYAAAQALQQMQIASAKGDFIEARGAAKEEAIAGMASTVNHALDTGTLGASFDLSARGAVRADQTQAVQAALAAKQESIAGARLQGTAALGTFYQGLGEVQTGRANAEAMAQIEAFKNDQFDTLQQNFKAMQRAVLAKLNKNRNRDKPAQGPVPSGTPGPGVGVNGIAGQAAAASESAVAGLNAFLPAGIAMNVNVTPSGVSQTAGRAAQRIVGMGSSRLAEFLGLPPR